MVREAEKYADSDRQKKVSVKGCRCLTVEQLNFALLMNVCQLSFSKKN